MSDHYILIIPAAERATANQRLEAGGHGPNNFSGELIARTGRDTDAATHYWTGIHPQYLYDFQKILAGLSVQVTKGNLNQKEWAKPAMDARDLKRPARELPREHGNHRLKGVASSAGEA